MLKNPFPFVIFKEFGNSSLNFDMYFWVDMQYASGLTVGSELRHGVTELFREQGVEIPFPQMDVHFKRELPREEKVSESVPQEPEKPDEDTTTGILSEDDMDPTEGILRG